MTEYRTLLSNFIKKSATIGLLRNDGTVDTTDYVSTSNTEGLIKNDGTIDTTSYLSAHQDITGKEDKSNKTSSWNSTTNDTRYPTEKLVKDSLDGKQDELVSGTNLKTLNGVDLLGEGDITIDVSCGGSTVIFEDDCSSVSGLSNYGSSVLIRGTNAIATISYDSTDNCYALTGSGNYHSAIPIPVLNDKDNYSIEADFKCGYNNELTTIGFVVRDYNDTSIQSTSFQLKGDGTFRKMNYTIGLDKDYTGEIISYSPYTYWVHMRLEITGASVKVELSYDGTIFKTYNYTTETITNRQVGLFLFCERGSTNSKCWVKNIKAEYLCESSTIIFEDDCSVDNSSTLFGNSVVLRNSGANTTAWNNGGYYTIQNTKGSSESMRVIAPLTGFTGDFTLEYDSYVESTDGASGFVIYDSSTSFVGLVNDGNNYGFFYNDGSYHETSLSSGDTKQKWVHFKFIVEGTNFTLECYENDVLQYTTTQTIHFNRSSSTMYGFEVKWTVNRITRYKNIVVKNNGSTTIFEDGGVTGNVNTDYVTSHSGVSATVSSTGTTVSSTTYADCYYIANVLLPKDWIAEFTIVSVNAFGGIAFLNSSKTKQWNVEYDLYTSPYGLKYYATNVETWISNDYSMGNTIKLKKQGTSLKIYLNNTLIATETITDINGYLAWKTHSHSSRSVTFKDFVIRRYCQTDMDSENTIYLGDDIMTMIDTALGHMITNWEDYE